jgi:hypothetical protein
VRFSIKLINKVSFKLIMAKKDKEYDKTLEDVEEPSSEEEFEDELDDLQKEEKSEELNLNTELLKDGNIQKIDDEENLEESENNAEKFEDFEEFKEKEYKKGKNKLN